MLDEGAEQGRALVNELLSQKPTQNVTNIFNLQPATPAFMPTNTQAPMDWSLPILQIPGTPTFSVAGGSYSAVQTVSINDSDATAGLPASGRAHVSTVDEPAPEHAVNVPFPFATPVHVGGAGP